MHHNLPNLPFEKTALLPYMSVETLDYHYSKHHKAYVDKLNQLILKTDFEKASLKDLILQATGPIFNNAAQVWNHTFFWNCLAPSAQNQSIPKALEDALQQQFGGVAAFKDAFEKSAIANFGSGWTWLVKKPNGSLAILNTSNAENPLQKGDQPLLTCDVWEHAYYIDHRNDRAKYVSHIWPIINWNFAAENLQK